jgi:DNA replication protein DnaC
MLLYHLCEREIARKNERRIEMTLKLARFPFVRDLTGFDFAAQPTRWGQLHHLHGDDRKSAIWLIRAS